jgi:hypothetical protein
MLVAVQLWAKSRLCLGLGHPRLPPTELHTDSIVVRTICISIL